MMYFEDIAVGSRESFGSYEVTREEIIEFAEKYDPQPFHLADEAAAQTHFGRIAASGWHTCSMVMTMIVENMQSKSLASLGAAGIDELRWRRPVYPGDTLRCETEVLDKQSSGSRPEMGRFRSRMSVFNATGELVLSFISLALVRTRIGASQDE